MKSIKHDYYKSKIIKMGHWSLMPLDADTQNTEHTSHYFYDVFGIYKGTLALCETDKGVEHGYFPQYYFDRLYKYIEAVNKDNYKSLSKALNKFYALKDKAKREIPKIKVKDWDKISDKGLLNLFKRNKNWLHRVTVYDQFGWTAEDYWPPRMEKILTEKLGLEKSSKEYYRVLFILTKPARISTTLEEKRDVLLEAYKVNNKKKIIESASRYLARKYGWMPVFAYGIPWDEYYYAKQLKELVKKNNKILLSDYKKLKNYSQHQKQDLKEVLLKYKINSRDLQLFIDFGLALDARNEAEYLVSLCGFYVMPIYKEMAKRLYISVKQLRTLFEEEIISVFSKKLDVSEILRKKGRVVGFGFNHKMDKRVNFESKEAEKLLKFLEKESVNLHGKDENQGMCASPGLAKGRVKLVFSPADNNRVKDGDILVCHATTVDYLPAMKKAAAFVTEIGSLTCHAAVVAREFGVPCVVSLKNATKNFKDGDLVEVDADKGIVRKV